MTAGHGQASMQGEVVHAKTQPEASTLWWTPCKVTSPPTGGHLQFPVRWQSRCWCLHQIDQQLALMLQVGAVPKK